MSEIRESLEAAYEKVTGVDAETPAAEPVAEVATADTGGADVAPDSGGQPAATEAAPTETAAEKAERIRDGKGRFAKTTTETPQKEKAPKLTIKGQQAQADAATIPPSAGDATSTQQPKPAETTQTPAPQIKAPQSWTPAAREKWNAIPAEIQQEIDKREKDMARYTQDSAQFRKAVESFNQTVSPYMPMFQANGIEPMKYIGQTLQAGAVLNGGNALSKAQLVASLVTNHNIPLELLAQCIDGVTPRAQPQGQGTQPLTPEEIERRVEDRLMKRMGESREAVAKQRAQEQVNGFKEKSEFYNDVRGLMRGIMSSELERGVVLSLEDAYTQACRAHPEVSKVLQQRELGQQANANAASTQRAKNASVSVRTQPAGVSGPQPRGIREVMAEAAAKLAASH
jgi:hypothetical protein